MTDCILSLSLPPVLLQQAFTNIEHTHHPGRCHDILPALLVDMLRKVASDDITGSDSLQQLLCFLQASQRQNSPRKGIFLLKQLVRPESQLDLGFIIGSLHFGTTQTCLRALYFFYKLHFVSRFCSDLP